MTFRLYTGEYLISPVALHWGLNWCTHACAYCFANLNNPQRRTDANDIKRVYGMPLDSETIEAWFLRQGHPILMANDSDPLAQSNIDTFMAVRDMCQKKGYRLTYQTKGGPRAYEDIMLDDDPTMIYVSLTSSNNSWLSRLEPGAPTFESRIDLIRRAKARGHHVVVGINPLVPAWWGTDWGRMVDMLASLGVRHAWGGTLHLSHLQVRKMPAKHKELFKDWLPYAMAKNKDMGAVMDLLHQADDAGINTFGKGVSARGGFWDEYFALGFPFMPTLDDFLSELADFGMGKPVVFGIDDLKRYCDIGAPDSSKYKEYCSGFGRSLRNTGHEPKARNYGEVIDYYWRIWDLSTVLRQDQISIAADLEKNRRVVYEDDAGVPLLVYVPRGCAEPFFELDGTGAIRYRSNDNGIKQRSMGHGRGRQA